MIRLFFAFFALAISASTFAGGTLPTIPNGCFDDKLFCSEWSIADVNGMRVIRVKFVAMAYTSDYPTPQSIVDKYFDFAHWGDYAQGTDSISIENSVLRGTEGQNDKLYHYVRYVMQAPFPISHMRIREVTQYTRMEPAAGAVLSYRFALVPGLQTGLPEYEDRYKTLNGPEGVKYKEGEIHIQYNQENGEYVLFMMTDVVPGIDLLPKVAAPYIERGIVAVAKGMLNL